MTSTYRRRRTRRSRTTGVLAGLALLALGVPGLLVVLVGLGVVIPWNVLGDLASLGVPALGPRLVVIGLVVAVLAWLLRRRLRRTATVVASAVGLATVAIAVAVTAIVVTTVQAGGSIDLLQAVTGTTVPGVPDDDIVYGQGPDGAPLHLAVYRPPEGTPGPVPVLVYVHGGGWNGGTRLDALADMRRLADQGRVVLSVEYTLATADRPTWDVTAPEVACALSTAAVRAGEIGGDPSRIVLTGDSAGGQIAVTAGYRAASGTAVSSCGGAVPVPRAVIAQYPAVDVLDAYENGRAPLVPVAAVQQLGVMYLGGTPQQVPDRYRAIMGTSVITPAAPETLVLSPARDVLVPPEGVEQFVEAARAAGVAVDDVSIPVANHAYDQLGTGSLGNQAKMTIVEHWLSERGL